MTIKPTGDTTIRRNLESQRLAINQPSNDDDIPLQIINNNQNWFVASLESTIAGDGCLMQWMAPASTTYWWSCVWGTNVNGFNLLFNSQGLSIKPTTSRWCFNKWKFTCRTSTGNDTN